MIDVAWIERLGTVVAAAFEVEHSTSIYSGIVRMLDLALGTEVGANSTMFLVAPDNRRDDVQQQLRRPAFSRVAELGIRYMPYSEIKSHREAISRFGSMHGWPKGALAWVCPRAAELVRRQDELRREFSISPSYFKAHSALLASMPSAWLMQMTRMIEASSPRVAIARRGRLWPGPIGVAVAGLAATSPPADQQWAQTRSP